MGGPCTCLCILDLFLAPAVMDFPFACFVRWCTIERSSTSRLLHLLSLPVAHRLLNAILGFRSSRRSYVSPYCGAPFNSDKSLFRQYRGGSLYSTRTVSTHPPYLLIFYPPISFFLNPLYDFACSFSLGKLPFQSPCPNRKVG